MTLSGTDGAPAAQGAHGAEHAASSPIHASPFAIVEWNRAGVILDANGPLLEMAHRTREELASRTLTLDLLFCNALSSESSRSSDDSFTFEGDLIRRDSSRIPVMLGMKPWDDARARRAAYVLDMTDQRRRTQQEETLLAVVSHDLRDPLAVVALAASLLKSEDLTDNQRKIVGRLDSASRQAVRLVSDLLDFTSARRSGIQLVRRDRDLHGIVQATLGSVLASWPGRRVQHERVGEATANVDEDRVAQVVANLVGNALQHSPRSSEVFVETRGESGAVLFSVANTGTPIPADLLPHLFAPWRRGAAPGDRHGSLGLGLFIAHHLVAAHGGTIDVVSNQTEGTRFSVRLPR